MISEIDITLLHPEGIPDSDTDILVCAPPLHPEGMPDSSRRLSEAIPPVCGFNSRTPKGCQKENDQPQRTQRTQRFLNYFFPSLRSLRFIFWHPFRVQRVFASVPGVSLRSTHDCFLTSLRDAKEVHRQECLCHSLAPLRDVNLDSHNDH